MAGRSPKKDYGTLHPGWPDYPQENIEDLFDQRVHALFAAVRAEYQVMEMRGEVSSVKDFARFLELPSGLVHNLMHGKTIPTVETIMRIESKVHRSIFPAYEISDMYRKHQAALKAEAKRERDEMKRKQKEAKKES